jgi:dCTP deaminase
MTILSGQTIRRRNILSPCAEASTFAGTSHGLGPAGYDLRLVLPKVVSQFGAKEHYIYPGEFMLVAAVERFVMPVDLVGIVHDKSTWARRGLAVQNTIIEPGWEGYLTLELTNHGREPLRLVEGQGIAQVVFHLLDHPAEQPYQGKYQNQGYGPQAARS